MTPREMAVFDYFAARGEAHIALPYSLGLVTGTTWPWFVATHGRSKLTTTLAEAPSVPPSILGFVARDGP